MIKNQLCLARALQVTAIYTENLDPVAGRSNPGWYLFALDAKQVGAVGGNICSVALSLGNDCSNYIGTPYLLYILVVAVYIEDFVHTWYWYVLFPLYKIKPPHPMHGFKLTNPLAKDWSLKMATILFYF
jgi:hypothetical protein